MQEWIDAGPRSELPPGTRKLFVAGPAEVALFNVEGRLFAIDNVCPHRGGPLSEGDLVGFTLHCPLHAWPFDLRSGRCTDFEAAKVRVHEVRLDGDRILVAREGRFADD